MVVLYKKVIFLVLYLIFNDFASAAFFLFPPKFGCNRGNEPFKNLRTNSCKCGRRPGLRNGNETRIIDGETTTIEQFPWMAQVVRTDSNYYVTSFCGGTVISDKYILTAAHCLYTVAATGDNIIIILGHTKKFGGRQILAADYAIHENFSYTDTVVGYDIAVVKASENIVFDNYIQPICLPCSPKRYDSFVYWHNKGDLTGWGITHQNPTAKAQQLQHAQRIPQNSNCCKLTVFKDHAKLIPDKTICGRGFSDVCSGDSGGPFSMNVNGISFEMGIVSFGSEFGCNKAFRPAVHTDVSQYADWIVEKTSDSTYCSI